MWCPGRFFQPCILNEFFIVVECFIITQIVWIIRTFWDRNNASRNVLMSIIMHSTQWRRYERGEVKTLEFLIGLESQNTEQDFDSCRYFNRIARPMLGGQRPRLDQTICLKV